MVDKLAKIKKLKEALEPFKDDPHLFDCTSCGDLEGWHQATDEIKDIFDPWFGPGAWEKETMAMGMKTRELFAYMQPAKTCDECSAFVDIYGDEEE